MDAVVPQSTPRSRQERERLFAKHQRLACTCLDQWLRARAGFVSRHRLERDDLKSVALLAVWTATEHWQPERGPFSTLAVFTVRFKLDDLLKPLAKKKRGASQVVTISLDARAPGDETCRRLELMPAPAPELPEEVAVRSYSRRCLWEAIEAIATLAPRQAQVLTLRFVEDLTVSETAARLGISRQAVDQSARQGYAKLRAACPHLAPDR